MSVKKYSIIGTVILFLCFLLPIQIADASVVVRQLLDEGVYAAIKGGRILYLECHLPKGDASQPILEKYLEQPEVWKHYKDISAVAIPYYKLNASTQRNLLESLFPDDYVDEKGWWHTVAFDGDTGVETWHAITLWLTGNGEAYQQIMNLPDNQQAGINLKQGQVILVPRRMLREELNALSTARPKKPIAPPPVSPPVLAKKAPEPQLVPINVETEEVPELQVEKSDSDNTRQPSEPALIAVNPELDFVPEDSASTSIVDDITLPMSVADLGYGSDGSGGYATYKMKSGDALYSSVVVRFTDFSENAEIHAALEVIQQRSGITDPRKMKAGQTVKIPLEMLADRYHPSGSERRVQFETVQTEVERLGTRRTIANGLEGVVLILDPGHGGRDQGAPWAKMGIFEDEVVYDISCRIKEILERDTQVRVHMTVKDTSQGFVPTNATSFKHDTDEVLLTTPPYPNEDARISANLRWYLANEIYRKELAQGTHSDKVLFASIHCDALYTPQLRGAMVYVPGAQYRRDSEQPSGAVYSSYSEVKKQPTVNTTYAQRVEDEALSRNFAQTLLKTLQHNDPPIKVHDTGDPIRNVIRQSGGRAYVPAVLRNTMVPTKVLVETANLTNTIDRQRVADPQWRQWFAEAFVKALRAHFEGQGDSIQVAAVN